MKEEDNSEVNKLVKDLYSKNNVINIFISKEKNKINQEERKNCKINGKNNNESEKKFIADSGLKLILPNKLKGNISRKSKDFDNSINFKKIIKENKILFEKKKNNIKK